ncbi:peptidoglycan DD-metalloendopeptidase family protein [Parapedobacter sp. ISTM3]|uniref:murein hydrolase activator EnvC family protein n=1 Tax=Parapedobacter sp. ISTM3 TaxID=2800130 RepID=UPI0019068E2C|nr:peptidoglycan DD-metalloendopeptidase family protein [Parapedobacter sp. ISTM3]MBK1439406.1 peptidoglycan DD-metalloendopeptidase family protein [Parapedobacter sp. ISTM3]
MNFMRVILSAFVVFLASATGFAQSSAELKKQRERLNREIEQLNQSLKTTSSDRSLSLKQVNALNMQLRLREQKISTINSEIRLINSQIASHNKTIQNLRNQLAKLRKDYENMVLFAFRNRNAYNKMMFIFASKDFNQAFKRVKYLQQFNESRKERAKEIEDTQKAIALKVAQLEANKKEQAALLAEQQEERKVIAQEQGAESKILQALTQQEKQFKQELQKKQQEDERLARAIRTAIQREIEEQRRLEEEARQAALALEAERTGKTVKEVEAENPAVRKSDTEVLANTPAAAKLSADFAGNRGRLPWPVQQGFITQGFGRHTVGRNVTVNNSGIKIRTSNNAPVQAIFDGTVRTVGNMTGVYFVLVQHGKYFSVYQNLGSLAVKRGQTVQRGQTLGTASVDPTDGTSEVHFELWEGATPINPEPWLAK